LYSVETNSKLKTEGEKKMKMKNENETRQVQFSLELRQTMSRKEISWGDVAVARNISQGDLDLLKSLVLYNDPNLATESPCEDFAPEFVADAPNNFLLAIGAKVFLVDRSGYDYARYTLDVTSALALTPREGEVKTESLAAKKLEALIKDREIALVDFNSAMTALQKLTNDYLANPSWFIGANLSARVVNAQAAKSRMEVLCHFIVQLEGEIYFEEQKTAHAAELKASQED